MKGLKTKIVPDYEKRVITIGRDKIALYRGYKSWRSFVSGVFSGLVRKYHMSGISEHKPYGKYLSDELGISPTKLFKVYKAIEWKVFIKPHEKVLLKYCFKFRSFVPTYVNRYYKELSEISSYMGTADEWKVPFLLYRGSVPEGVDLSKQSLSRAKVIAAISYPHLAVDIPTTYLKVWNFQATPQDILLSSLLKRGRLLKCSEHYNTHALRRELLKHRVENCFLDLKKPSEEELIMFTLDAGIDILERIKEIKQEVSK